MNLTQEQKTIVDHITVNEGLTMVSAVAGAGKTTLLVSIANTITHTSGLYIAYNKSVATEASRKFPKTVVCSTVH